MDTKKSQETHAAEIDRRQNPRVKLAVQLVARHVGRGDSFVVEEASVGGFSVVTAMAFEPDSQHHFRFAGPSGDTAIVSAICRHCTRIEGQDQTQAYRAGFQFLSQPTRRLRIILGAVATDAP